MNKEQFIQSIRTKYPVYDTVADDVLYAKIIEKYPVYKDRITDEQPVAPVAKEGLITDLKSRVDKGSEAILAAERGEQSGASAALQTLGQGAAAVGDVALAGIKTLTPKPIEELAATGMEKVGEAIGGTETAQAVADKYAQFKAEHPEAAANLEATGLLATILPIGKGAQLATKGVVKGVEKGLEVVPKVKSTVGEKLVERGIEKSSKEAMDIAVIGPLGKKQTVASLERSGRQGGYTPDTTWLGRLTGADKYVPTEHDKGVAKSVEGLVSKNNSPAKNITNINSKIAEVSETSVRPALKANPQPFNVKTYAKRLRDVETPDFIKADKPLENTYNMVRERFIKVVQKHPKTKEGLWDARKEIDDVIEEQFGASSFNPDKYSALQRAVLDMRRATNDFIGEGIEDNLFKKEMQNLSRMYEARHNIALENYRVANAGKIEQWVKQNPAKAKAVKGLLIATGLGVGSTFIP